MKKYNRSNIGVLVAVTQSETGTYTLFQNDGQ